MEMKQKILLIVVLSFLLLISINIQAYGGKIYNEISPAEMKNILEKMGIESEEIFRSEMSAPALKFKLKGIVEYPVGLFFYNPTNGRYSEIEIVASFLLPEPLEPRILFEIINEWNANERFLNAFFSSGERGQVVVVTSDLNLAGGVREENIKKFMEIFKEEVNSFIKYLSVATSS
jgi:hypothetical protein